MVAGGIIAGMAGASSGSSAGGAGAAAAASMKWVASFAADMARSVACMNAVVGEAWVRTWGGAVSYERGIPVQYRKFLLTTTSV